MTRWADQHGAVVFRYSACASWPFGLWVLLLADGRLWARRSLPPGTPQDLYAVNATQAMVVLQRRTTLAIWRTTSGGVAWHAVAVFTST
ncbi:MAG: hypothetical protein OWR62_12060 [Sulfobacillus thermotolerans]|nr:hypothetical protein [Sulfobacillus thermotolerans]